MLKAALITGKCVISLLCFVALVIVVLQTIFEPSLWSFAQLAIVFVGIDSMLALTWFSR